MAKTFYKTKNSYRPNGGSPSQGVSQTVQGEAKSLAQMLQRAMEGYPLARKHVMYFDEEDLNRINQYHAPHSLDLVDLEQLQTTIDSLQQTIDQAREEREKNPPATPEVVTTTEAE